MGVILVETGSSYANDAEATKLNNYIVSTTLHNFIGRTYDFYVLGFQKWGFLSQLGNTPFIHMDYD